MNFDFEKYKPMPVSYELRLAVLKCLQRKEDPLPDIEGRYETKKDVLRCVLSGSSPYLVSREGTGKTRLAEGLARLLPPVPKVKGCPYNCDPKWPNEWKCPTCRDEDDPEWELISGVERYSRIQGNEYTNESKILGVKDIQAIVQGGSPTDPRTFIGTGILRGNRGVVCVDELPAIPTKVQVLFHPILQEGKIILEEYNWVRPIDIFFIATGNPTGFSHVNRVPEPLLDRLELITMGFPEEDVERDIMLKEGFRIHDDFYVNGRIGKVYEPVYAQPSDLKRRVFAPWWIINIVVKVVRYSRDCPNIDRGASIRGSIRSLDHTLSTAELNNRLVVGLADVSEGLKLALRGRLRLRADLLGLDDSPITFMRKNEEVVEDILWYAARDVGISVLKALEDDFDLNQLTNEINETISQGKVLSEFDSDSDMVKVIRFIEQQQPWKNPSLLSDVGDLIRDAPKYVEEPILNAYRVSAVELLAHTINASKETELIPIGGDYFTPKKMK